MSHGTRRSTRATIAAFAMCAVGCSSGAPAASAPRVAPSQARLALTLQVETLANGLRVIVNEDHRLPVVSLALCYRVGSKDDPDGRSGLAHLYEHLMFLGTKHTRKFAEEMRDIGARWNAQTTQDETTYWEVVPSASFERALWLEADRMAFGGAANDLPREREVVKNERRERVDEAPYGAVHELIAQELYPVGHPYRSPLGGTMADLDAISSTDVQQFKRRHYVPDAATLVVVGDVKASEALASIGKYFGGIPARGGAPAAVREEIPNVLDEDHVLRIEANVGHPRLYAVWPTPRAFAGKWLELRVATGFVAASAERVFVKESEDAVRTDANWSPGILGSTVELRVDLKNGKSITNAKSLAYDAINRLTRRYSRFSSSTSQSVAEAYTSQLFYELEGVQDRAETLATFDDMANDPLYPFKIIRAARALEPDDIQNELVDELFLHHAVYALVEPDVEAPRAGRLAKGTSR